MSRGPFSGRAKIRPGAALMVGLVAGLALVAGSIPFMVPGGPAAAQMAGNNPQPDDARAIRCQYLKPGATSGSNCAGGGAEIPILDTRVNDVVPIGSAALSGPGNLEMVQIALDCGGGKSTGDTREFTTEGKIKFYRDGEAVPAVTMTIGQLLCRYGTDYTAPDCWAGPDLSLAENDAAFVGGYTRLFVPFAASLRITYQSSAASAGSVDLFTQAYYRLGPIPTQTGGPGTPRARLRQSYLTPWTNVAGLASADFVNVTGMRGELERVTLALGGTNANNLSLEGHVKVYVDGAAYQECGGTEDYFGGNFYFGELKPRTLQWGCAYVGTNITTSAPQAGNHGCSVYRLFGRQRGEQLTFNTSLRIVWTNGQTSAGTPATAAVCPNVLYYTDQ